MGKIDTFEINGATYELEDSNAVRREPGKDLITDEERVKLSGIEDGAEANVQPDWDESDTDSDAFIRNKPDLSGFITKTVNDLANYYLKSETYTKEEVVGLIAAIRQFHYEVYATLPQTGEGNVLYLIGPTGSGSDRYEEYVYANGEWVKIGDTSIDLSGYATTGALSSLSDGLLSGSIVPRLAEDLASWDDESLMTEDTQTVSVFTTGGDISIKSSVPAQLTEIAAKTDFSASALRASGFNLLRLKSNDGLAVAVGSGYYFPVPALHFGTINTAEQPNGVLFTDSAGDNLRPTVYFKKASAGVPTSVTDGTVCSYVDASWNGGTLRFFTTSEPGWLVVSGITWADTCAHIGWSKRYDKFISPTDESDAGHSVDLSVTISAMHSFGKMLTVGSSADRIRRLSAEQVQWETECDRVQPTWTNTLQEDGETYLHTATISAMKSDGVAQFETATQPLTISGTSISYTDSSESALTDYVKYEKATVATGVRTLATDFNVEDWGLIVLLDAVGEAYTTIAYAQGIPDNVRALVSARLSGQMGVVAQAFAELYGEVASLKEALQGGGGIPRLSAPSFDSGEYRSNGIPMAVEGAGAPSSSVVPKDWEKLCPGVVWTGIPLTPGMMYFDNAGNKWYKAKMTLAGTVSDWVLLN